MKLDEIINSWENRPEAFTGEKTDVATFIGPKSDSWDQVGYQRAREMTQAGYSPEHIWKETYTGRDPITGDWKQEISDLNANLLPYSKIVEKVNANDTNEQGALQDYMTHPDLYKAYPGVQASQLHIMQSPVDELGNSTKGRAVHIPGGFGGDGEGPTGSAALNTTGLNKLLEAIGDKPVEDSDYLYDLDNINDLLDKQNLSATPDQAKILKNMAVPNMGLWGGTKYGVERNPYDILSTMLHENQHSIQSLEGWGTRSGNADWTDFVVGDGAANNYLGSNLNRWDTLNDQNKNYQAYLHQPAEVEARLTQTRMDLNDQERRDNYPFEQKSNANPYGYDVNPDTVKGLLDMFNNQIPL